MILEYGSKTDIRMLQSGSDPCLRKLKIQTGVVKRMTKEKFMYDKEIAEAEQNVEKLMKEGRSTYNIRKQEEALEESRKMVPTVMRKLKDACEQLQGIMTEVKHSMSDMEVYQTAESTMEAARAVLEPPESSEQQQHVQNEPADQQNVQNEPADQQNVQNEPADQQNVHSEAPNEENLQNEAPDQHNVQNGAPDLEPQHVQIEAPAAL